MSLATVIRSAIKAAAPPPRAAFQAPAESAADAALRCAALLELARRRLRDAHAGRARAEAELRAADSKVERALEVIAGSERADREAGEAEATARAAAREWSTAGCPEESRPDQDLLDRSAQAAEAAADARTLAAGAMEALPGLREAAREARMAFSRAEEQLRTAVADVLTAQIEPRLVELARARDAYLGALRPIAYVRHLFKPWGPAHPLHGFPGPGTAIDARLRELAIEPLAEPDVAGGAHDLRALAQRLLEDPGAKV
ncbi:MAG: hypothetical protein ACYCUE_01205 [Steroidobacteraceae bacterium]